MWEPVRNDLDGHLLYWRARLADGTWLVVLRSKTEPLWRWEHRPDGKKIAMDGDFYDTPEAARDAAELFAATR